MPDTQSASGIASSHWVFSKATEIAGNRTDILVTQFAHAAYEQRSVIVHIRGRNPNGPLVIIGAHQDSINGADVTKRSPGADDDGTGSMSIMEIFRALVDAHFVSELPLEFHWYAAEEVGLLGSQDIAQSYKNGGKSVFAYFNLDMTGYQGGPDVKVVYDFTNLELANFSAKVIEQYTSLSWVEFSCNYACSDHASWNRAGYAGACVFEPGHHPEVHTERDDLDLINWPQTYEFLKLGLAFIVELSFGEAKVL